MKTSSIEWLNSELILTCVNNEVVISTEDGNELATITADDADWTDGSILGIGQSSYEEDKAFLEAEARSMIKKPTANAKAKEAVVDELKGIANLLSKRRFYDDADIIAKKMLFDQYPATQYFGAEQIEDLWEVITTIRVNRVNAYDKVMYLATCADYDCVRELVESVILYKYKVNG